MGSGGEDLIMARDARTKVPYSIECKNQEKINVWESYNQAKENCKGYEPIVVMKRNKSDPLVVIDAKTFINLHKRSDNGKLENLKKTNLSELNILPKKEKRWQRQ